MNILRRTFAALAATEQDRALAREIRAYPATAGSAMIVLPRTVPSTARADLSTPVHFEMPPATGSHPVANPHLRLA